MNRTNYIFLTNQYMPRPGATGVCVHQIAKYMASQGEDVSVICYGEKSHLKEEIDGIKVIRIKEPFFIRETYNIGIIKHYCARIAGLILKLLYINKYPLRSRLLVKQYVKAVSYALQKDVNTVIIASYTPLEGVIAAAECKKKKLASKIIYYSTDTLSNEKGELGIIPQKKRTRLGLKWERYLFSVYDRIILMECHKKHYNDMFFRDFFPKMSYASFPLIVKPDKNGFNKTESYNIKRMVFAGNLYKKMRNPVYICNLLNTIALQVNLKTTFIGGGDCDAELKIMCEASNGMINYVGFKPHNYVENELRNADILLSIGNSYSEMCPSKIYEYMSTGKPIVHSYTYDADPCLDPLRHYGNALLIKEGEERNFEKLISFMEKLKSLDFSSIEGRFVTNTPKYTANIITSE